MEAADRGEVAIEPGLVAEKENLHAVALVENILHSVVRAL